MGVIRRILKVLLGIVALLVVILNLLLAAGTVFDSLPLFGTIANVVTISFSHLWLAFLFLFTMACFLVANHQGSRFYRLLGILSSVTFLCGVFFISSAIQAVNAQGGNASFWKSYRKEPYGNVSKQTVRYEETISDNSYMDIYFVDDGQKDKPVVLSVHGGGWISGSRDNSKDSMRAFAKNGYVAVTAEYDLSSKDQHRFSTVEKQLVQAVDWIGEHISTYGGDGTMLYLSGDSAGGNLALQIAYRSDMKTKIRAVSVLYPVTDMKACYHNGHPLFTETAKEMVYDYMGKTPEEDPELYASASPLYRVTSGSPPTCILVGKRDTVVSPSQSEVLAQRLDALDVDHKLVEVPYANHLFDMGGVNFAAQAYLHISLDWFASH